MLEQKIAHPQAGANTAWVPSPTAATLHALHYHQVDVFAVQKELEQIDADAERDALLDDLLTGAGGGRARTGAPAERQQELDNNAQGILGYVRALDRPGRGLLKVPDIHNVGLMEDRATLRISSQHIANWLHHGIVSEAQVRATFAAHGRRGRQAERRRPAVPADGRPRRFSSAAYHAALDLVFRACEQPSGYTEPLLHAWRQQVKAAQASIAGATGGLIRGRERSAALVLRDRQTPRRDCHCRLRTASRRAPTIVDLPSDPIAAHADSSTLDRPLRGARRRRRPCRQRLRATARAAPA